MNEDGVRQGPIGLYENEVQCLVALSRLLVGLDRRFSEQEADALSSLALEVGEDSFWTHVQSSYEDDIDLSSVLDLAKSVERKEARNAIYAALADLASCDTVDRDEQGLLTRLEQLWQLEISELT